MVTIVVPVYNSSVTLRETLVSVQNQSHQDWECIIVDDCSSDNSVEIAQIFARNDNRFFCLQHESNRGVSYARNTALQIAKGKYIQFLDADDVIAPDKLTVQKQFLEINDSIDIVYSNYFHFKEIPDFESVGILRINERPFGVGSKVIRSFLKGNSIRINTPLFRDSIIKEFGAFDTSLSHVEDWEFWFRCALHNKSFYFLDDPCAIAGVRIREGSLSSDSIRMRDSYFIVMQRVWHAKSIGLLNRIYWLYRLDVVVLNQWIFQRSSIHFLNTTSHLLRIVILVSSFMLLPLYLITIGLRTFKCKLQK